MAPHLDRRRRVPGAQSIVTRRIVGRSFASSYLARDAAASLFFPHDFRDVAARVTLARAAAQRRIAPALAEVLREQQALLPASPARTANLDALLGGDCAVVVSGQQVGLFLGPLYTFYKAASAIAVARAIERESGVRCVPLFWLQTEDHDFAEISSCRVTAGDSGLTTLSLAPDADPAARVSVAHRVLGPEITGLIDVLAGQLARAGAAGEVIATLRAHYVPGRPLAQAFAGTLAAIFSDEGLLFLNPRDARIAALAAPLYRRSLQGAGEVAACLDARASALRDAGFDQQVPLRPDASLLFFHEGEPEGPRHRLQRDGDGWRTGSGHPITTDQLLACVATRPLCFSTSALLRPLVQDALLPTVAYVGGPAEVSYFAQLMPLYRLFDLAPALVVPRARFTCVDARARRLLRALHLTPPDLALPAHELRRRLPVVRPAGAPDPEALKQTVATGVMPEVDALTQAIAAALPHLARAAGRTRRSVDHVLRRLTDRYGRELLERDATTARQLQRLKDLLLPDGAPQERVHGWPLFAAQVGPAAFKRAVFDALEQAGTFVTQTLELRP
jgi:bacillithiol biosynthesis cysteine-adding enzyme BshC